MMKLFMPKEYITHNFSETQALGKQTAENLQGGQSRLVKNSRRSEAGMILCLEGDLGAGKTTFTQGLLEGLGAEGPYTSPTFLIMKHYKKEIPNSKLQTNLKIQNIYHFDAYRVGAEDVLSLGWEEIITDPKNVVIVEWPEKIEKILPKGVIKIKFEWIDQDERKITFQ